MERIIGIILFVVLIVVVVVGITQGLHSFNFKQFALSIKLPKFAYTTSTAPTATSGPKAYVPSTPRYYAPPVSQTINQSPKPTPPAGFSQSDLSPYYGQVKVGYVSPSSYWGTPSQVSIRGDYSMNKSGVDVTGWHIKSNMGDVLIPQSILDYDPSGGLAAPTDIVLRTNNSAVLYSNASPMGRNLRLNKCIGYLNNNYNFNPQLPNSCPSFNRDAVSSFSGACQSYIFSLGSCQVASPSALNQFSGPYDYACQDFLRQISYSSCYRSHRGDSDFFSNDWWVWLGSSMVLDSAHDRVLLLDRSGLLVDQYLY